MEFQRAHTVEEAIALLAEVPGSYLLAGGTDLMIKLRHHEVHPARIVDISRIPELLALEEEADGRIRLGAGVTFSRLLASPLIREKAPILQQMAAQAGAVQLRNLGTIGGNVANAALAADSLPVLIALEAEAEIAGPQGRRRERVADLVTGPGRTTLQPGELIVAFRFVPPQGKGVFVKVGRRNALNIARLSMSAIGHLDAAGRIAEVRLVPGAALRRTRRVTEVEAMLIGQEPDEALFTEAGKRMAEVMIEASGRRWSTPYKEPVIATLTRRALRALFLEEAAIAEPPLDLLFRIHGEAHHEPHAEPPAKEHLPHLPIPHEGERQRLSFTLNGEPVSVEVPVGLSLLTMLRDTFGLLAAKEGCDSGECGACTVILDGEAVLSCMVLAHQVEGREVITIEGLHGEGEEEMTDLQRAFIEHGAVQCGMCIPGMLMSAEALLMRDLHPTREEIRYAIAGNLCRCTGYQQIVDAIEAAAKERARRKG